MNFEKENNTGSGMENEPEGRGIGEKISNSDLITIGALSGTMSIVLETDKLSENGKVPAYTWLQEIDIEGNVIAEPHMGPPVAMDVMTGEKFFEEIKKHSS